MAEGQPYQYYTIISEADNGNNFVESDDQIVYLTVEPDTNTNTIEANSLADLKTEPGLKLITLGDGTVLLTSEDETYNTIEPQLIRNDSIGEDQNERKKDTSEYEIVEVVENDSSHFIRMLYYDDQNLVTESSKKEKSFVCTYEGCGKMYTMLHHLNVHMRNHMDCKPYVCNEDGCHKTFSTNYSLKAHIRTHTGEKPYSCTICPKCFKTSGDLQKHVRIHTGEKPFMCPIEGCNKSFTTSNIRKVHIRSHTCDYPNCGKAFSSSTNYKNHIRIHSGEKPYVCNVEGCSKRFTEYSSLYKHNLVHQPDRPLTCEHCGQKFKQESSINIHKRVKHNVVVAKDGTEVVVNI